VTVEAERKEPNEQRKLEYFIDADLYQALVAHANLNNTSVSGLLRRIVQEWLIEHKFTTRRS
jgi:hypothetical protein